MDLEPPVQVVFEQILNATASPVHHILSGSFRSLSLFLLAFSPVKLTLDLVQTIPAFGPHQYIGLGPHSQNGDARVAYTTSWALPPKLHSWAIEQQSDSVHVRLLNSVDITATSSYITVPPPYSHLYSAGGPSAQVHQLPPANTPGIGPHVQEIYFVPTSEWDAADKTRKALRYGSHGIEFAFPAGSPALAFIPVLGGSTIEIYSRAEDGSLINIDSSPAPQRPGAVAPEEDGPRHVKVHPNGRVLYCVTEHSNYLDVYTITPPAGQGPILTYVASRSLIPPRLREAEQDNTTATDAPKPTYRGDTLALAPSTPEKPAPESIFVTTRGGEGETTRGWVSVFRLDAEGMFSGDIENNPYLVERYEARTTGGKAHALDIKAKADDPDGGLWVILTDDSPPQPGVRVLEWDGWLWRGGGTRLREVVAWPPVGFYPSDAAKEGEPEQMAGGSHAVWLD